MTGTTPLNASRLSIHRGTIVGVAVAAIILGVIALFFPSASLLTIAVIFGLSLVVLGLFRLIVAFTATDLSTGMRWLTGILGALILIAAVVCLIDPFQSLRVLGLVIGIGWIFEGATGIIGGTVGYVGGPRWYSILAGIVSVIAGIVVMILPVAALSVFVTVAAIILIVVGIVTLAHLPRRSGVGGTSTV
jgi:uncharacterized membrane protein HdeD (DUF308 family)